MYKAPAYVGIILKKDNQILLVKRTNTDWASGQWNFPGGLLEENETLIAAAVREAQEEVGVKISPNDLQLVHVLQVQKNETHTKDIIGFYFMATTWHGTALNKEPHRHSEIGWFTIDELPQAITEHAQQALFGLKKRVYFSVK
ncbi:MAG: NUDIX hydrolase [Candidatus Babeliales bacterium]